MLKLLITRFLTILSHMFIRIPDRVPETRPPLLLFASKNANLNGLDPQLADKVISIVMNLQRLGWKPVIAEAVRTKEQQAEKVKLGYSKTMNSKHIVGKAVDIIDRRYGWDGPASDLNYQFWVDLGKEVKKEGLTWGGDWKSFKDVAHVEIS